MARLTSSSEESSSEFMYWRAHSNWPVTPACPYRIPNTAIILAKLRVFADPRPPYAQRTSAPPQNMGITFRSEEPPSELQSLLRISYAVFCSKTKHTQRHNK